MRIFRNTHMDYVEEGIVCPYWLWSYKIAVISYKYGSFIVRYNIFYFNLFKDAKVVTIFNMIAVPCFVYQGAVGLIGDLIQELAY